MKEKPCAVKKSASFLCMLVLSLCLNSCASKSQTGKNLISTKLRSVYITNSKKVNLLLPENNAGVFDGLQLLNGSFGEQSFNLLSYTQIDSNGISLSLMNDFGTDIGNLFYDGDKVIFDSAYFPKSLPGEYIICDIQNAFYDTFVLEENYKNAGLIFEKLIILRETGSPEEYRRIYDGKKLIEEIKITYDTVTIKNYLRGYEYELTKVEE